MKRHELQLLIRADVGPRIGTGHVMRCLALGQAWKKLGGTVAFACDDMPGSLTKRINDEGFRCFDIQNHKCDATDAHKTNELIRMLQPDWLAIDGYRFDDQYQDCLEKLGTRLLVVDDFGNATHRHADLILNQNAYAGSGLTDSTPPDQENLLLGLDFLLLRNEFQNIAQNDFQQPLPSTARRILVTFGGADPENWTLKSLVLLKALRRKDLVVDVVIGPANQHVATLREFARSSEMNIRLHQNVDRIGLLMSRVEFCLTAGGATCYELARCGVPSLIVSIADNQIALAKEIHQRGCAHYAGHHLDLDPRIVASTLMELLDDAGQRKQMIQSGLGLIDGQGSHRIARRMASELFSLRPAKMQDAEILHSWRNNPEVRAISFDSKPIPLTSHRTWLRQQINSDNSTLWIAQNKRGDRMGQVRFDWTPAGNLPNRIANSASVSIIVAPAYRGKGFGTMLIEKACRLAWQQLPIHEVKAIVKPSNTASIRSFRKAGFQAIAPTVVNGLTAMQFVANHPRMQQSLTDSQLKKSA